MHPAYGTPAKKHQQGWGSTTSSRQVWHWRLPAHRKCHSHATATPVADTTKQTNICRDIDDVPHSVQPCWYTSGIPPQPHLPSNQRPFTTIPCTTHTNYSVQDIILSTSRTPLVSTTEKCGKADTLDSFKAQHKSLRNERLLLVSVILLFINKFENQMWCILNVFCINT
jgi:hypothetical protein